MGEWTSQRWRHQAHPALHPQHGSSGHPTPTPRPPLTGGGRAVGGRGGGQRLGGGGGVAGGQRGRDGGRGGLSQQLAACGEAGGRAVGAVRGAGGAGEPGREGEQARQSAAAAAAAAGSPASPAPAPPIASPGRAAAAQAASSRRRSGAARGIASGAGGWSGEGGGAGLEPWLWKAGVRDGRNGDERPPPALLCPMRRPPKVAPTDSCPAAHAHNTRPVVPCPPPVAAWAGGEAGAARSRRSWAHRRRSGGRPRRQRSGAAPPHTSELPSWPPGCPACHCWSVHWRSQSNAALLRVCLGVYMT